MNWEKLKTFLIVLFSCINIFLIVTTILTTKTSSNIPIETIQDTVKILKQNSITVSDKLIPAPVAPMENIKLENLAYTEKFPKNAKILSDQNFEITLPDIAKSNRELKNMLSKAGFPTKYIDFTQNLENGKTVARQMVNGYEVFGSYLLAETKEQITVVTGKWYAPLSLPQRSASNGETALITSILIDFISNSERPQESITITDISFGYHIPMFDSGITHLTVTATPSWKITLNTGASFYYDARTGENIT